MGIRRLLRELPQDRKPVARNLALARKVAIVYMVEDEKAHNHVRNYVKKIKEELGISNIMALGYSDQKGAAALPARQAELRCHLPEGPELVPHPARQHRTELHGRGVRGAHRPHHGGPTCPYSTSWPRAAAASRWAAWSESNKKILDMMIDMAGSRSLPQMIQQVHHYLLMVNSKPEPSLN
jgi:hypothetical protein